MSKILMMMHYKRILNQFIVILSLGFAFSCQAQDCHTFVKSFKGYKDAITSIKSTSFHLEEKCDVSKSSWILGAEYYSCDGRQGYLLINTAKKTYIHYGLPIEIWNKFKNADSFGKFYNTRIKGKYQIVLNK